VKEPVNPVEGLGLIKLNVIVAPAFKAIADAEKLFVRTPGAVVSESITRLSK
jgi:hypothetical protein